MADNNPHQFSTQTTNVTFAQITDNTDFPHTGLIKALSLIGKGNMALKGSVTDFDITQATTGNVIVVKSGKIYRDGALHTIPSNGADTNFTSSAFNTTADAGSLYHLLVADSSNTLQIRKLSDATIADIVPEYDEGDTIIAVIMFNSSTAALGSMQIQFLTTGKIENSLSVGYSTGSSPNQIYNEAGSLTGDSNGITMTGLYKLDTLPTATVAANDKVIIQDTNDSDKIKTVTTQAIANLAGGGGGDSIEDADSDTKIQVEESSDEDKIRFDTAGTERMIIDETGKVGVGTSSPSELFHVKGNVLIEDGTANGSSDHLLELKSASSGDNARFILSADTDIKLPLIHLRDVEANSGTFSHHYSAYIALDRASAIVTGSAQNDLLIANGNHNKDIHFCTNPTSAGTQAQAKMTVQADGKVGIGTTTPSQELDVSGDIRLSGEIEINGNLNHDGSNVGFFGTAVASRQNVGNGSFVTNPANFGRPPADPNAFPGFEPNVDNYIAFLENEIVTVSSKLNDLIDALQLYGLIL